MKGNKVIQMTTFSALSATGELPSQAEHQGLFTHGCQSVLAPSLRAFLETLHEAVMEMDTEGYLQWCNAEARRMIHPIPCSMEPQKLLGIIAEQDRDEFEEWFARSMVAGAPTVCIVKLARDTSRRLLEFQRWSPPSANLENNVWILARDLSTWAVQMQQARVRDRLLSGIAQASEALLGDVEVRQAVPNALRELGQATGVDRVYLFENETCASTGEVATTQRFEWCQQGIEPQIDNADLNNFPFSTLIPCEFKALASGQVLGGPVRLMGDTIRNVLERQGILSALLVPIILEQHFWGFVGFDECHWERDWTVDERATLKAFAGSIGVAIQRERTLQRIRESEKNLQHVIEGSNDGFWDWNVQAGTVNFSPRLLGMLGYAPNSWEGNVNEWMKRVHPEDLAPVMRMVTQHLEGKTDAYQAEHRIKTASGSWRWILDRGKVVERDSEGRPIRAVGVHTDIHPLKEAQHALAESEGHLVMALSAARMHTFHHAVHEGWIHRIGLKPGCCGLSTDQSSDGFFGCLDPADAVTYKARLAELSPGAPDYTVEYRASGSEGIDRWFCDRGRGEFDESGALANVSGVSMDITQQRQTATMLNRRTELLRGLFEAVPVAVVVMDSAGIIQQANASATDLFHRSPASLVGTALASLLSQSSGEGDTQSGKFHEALAKLPDGSELPVEVSQSSFGPPGDATRVAVIRDISEQQRAKEQTLRALTRERDLNRLRSSFITLVSHEFRTPLAHILMSAELLEDCYDQLPAPRRLECFTSIKARVRSLTNMMQDVLTLGDLEAGQRAFAPRPVDLASYCREVLAEFQSSLTPADAEKAAMMQVSIASASNHVLLDRRLMSTTLNNLLSNAVKYSPRGAGPIEFRVRPDDGSLVFEVQDSGIGVPPEARPRLFEEFFRARNVGSIPGTGVGLSIVRLCSHLHGGTVTYAPVRPAGSLFSVSIPLISPNETKPLSSTTHPEPCLES